MPVTRYSWLLLFGLCSAGPAAALDIERRVIPETGLSSWAFADHGFSLELVQLQGDFIRAIYGSRGFSKELIDEIAAYCVFGSIARNLSDGPLSYRVAEWRVTTDDGRELVPRTKSEWVARWKKAGIPYNWSILPDDQTLDVGDWNQGFTTVKAGRGSRFRLTVSWTVEGETHEASIPDMRCPPDQIPAH
jgi:hypothetical protein